MASAGPEVALRAWPQTKSEQEPLNVLVARINEQRGSFRNVSEQSLLDEIERTESGLTQDATDSPLKEDEPADLKSHKEELLGARKDILEQVAQAQMQSAYALDFISLLLSKHTPRQAEISISPALKSSVPMGCLGSEVVQLPQIPESKRVDERLISTGWKLQTLHTTADSLLRSATRLEKEMKEEARYWEQILLVKDRGWSVCRLPRENHTLGVRYGFAEAAPEFRDRGIAALRRTGGGDINMDFGLRAAAPRVFRIRIQQGNVVTASSTNSKDLQSEPDPAEASLVHARNYLFDEELYNETYREARTLTNRGVKCMSDAVVLPIGNNQQLLMDLVSTEEALVEEQNSSGISSELKFPSKLPNMIAAASRILLCYAHRQNLSRRSQLPPPLMEQRPVRHPYFLVRPVLTILQHQNALQAVSSLLQSLKATLMHAAINVSFVVPNGFFQLVSATSLSIKSGYPAVETLAKAISSPLQSSVELTAPSSSSIITIQIRTHFIGPEYRVTTSCPPTSLLYPLPKESHFVSLSELERYLLHLLTIDIMSMLVSCPDYGKWSVLSLHDTQLSTESGLDCASQLLCISLTKDRLEVEWQFGGPDDADAGKKRIWNFEDQGLQTGLFDEIRNTYHSGGTKHQPS